jgi:hypothetical protein
MKIKTLILFIVGLMVLSSCKKESLLPEPAVDFKIGHVITDGVYFSNTFYKNQETLYLNEIDTFLIITVIENNLTSLGLDTLESPNPKDFTIYLNTLYDDERFCTCERAYDDGGGWGTGYNHQVTNLSRNFLIPVRKSASIVNNKKVELGNPDFLRISYESVYTGLNRVKTIVIL